jgi:hypothetical protein
VSIEQQLSFCSRAWAAAGQWIRGVAGLRPIVERKLPIMVSGGLAL